MEWIRGEGHQHSGPILLPPSLSLLHWNCVCCFSSGQGSLSFSSSSSSSPSSTIYQSLYITSCFLSTFSLRLSPFYPPPFLAAASLTKTNCSMLLIFFCSLLLCPPYVPPSPIEDNQQQRIRRQKGKKKRGEKSIRCYTRSLSVYNRFHIQWRSKCSSSGGRNSFSSSKLWSLLIGCDGFFSVMRHSNPCCSSPPMRLPFNTALLEDSVCILLGIFETRLFCYTAIFSIIELFAFVSMCYGGCVGLAEKFV